MNNDNMRNLMNIVVAPPAKLNEGVIDSVKKWFRTLSDPIKNATHGYVEDLQSLLASRYGAAVPPQVKSANKTWMFGKLTYQLLYLYSRHLGFTDPEIERALKNKIVTNTLNRTFALMPAGVQKPQLPLTINAIKNNPNFISTMIDRKTKVYLSKTLATIILESLAYVKAEQEKLAHIQAKSTRQNYSYDNESPYVEEPSHSPIQNVANKQSIDDLRSALAIIKQGLSSLKGPTA